MEKRDNKKTKSEIIFDRDKLIAQGELIRRRYGRSNFSINSIIKEVNEAKEIVEDLQKQKSFSEREGNTPSLPPGTIGFFTIGYKSPKKPNEESEKEILKYLKNIDNNLNKIANATTDIHRQLIILDVLIKQSNKSIKDIKNQVDTNNKINAEIYETIVSSNISDEKERLEVMEKLISGGADISTITTSLISIGNMMT